MFWCIIYLFQMAHFMKNNKAMNFNVLLNNIKDFFLSEGFSRMLPFPFLEIFLEQFFFDDTISP